MSFFHHINRIIIVSHWFEEIHKVLGKLDGKTYAVNRTGVQLKNSLMKREQLAFKIHSLKELNSKNVDFFPKCMRDCVEIINCMLKEAEEVANVWA